MLLAPLVATAAEPASPGDALLGKWWFPKKNGKMEITYVDGRYVGKVIEYEKPEQLDENNPDPALQSRKFVGIEMLRNFTYDPDDQKWTGGTIYDGDSGKTYKGSMWFEDGDTSQLHARGYVGVSFFGRTEIFTRVSAEDEPAPAKPPEGQP